MWKIFRFCRRLEKFELVFKLLKNTTNFFPLRGILVKELSCGIGPFDNYKIDPYVKYTCIMTKKKNKWRDFDRKMLFM